MIGRIDIQAEEEGENGLRRECESCGVTNWLHALSLAKCHIQLRFDAVALLVL